MPTSFQQTDTNLNGTIGSNVFCSGRTNNGSYARECTIGGTAGTTSNLDSLGSAVTLVVMERFKLVVPDGISWLAGTWTWRYEVSGANMNISLEEVHICRVNSSNVNQQTIGSATGLGVGFGATGVLSGNITGVASTPAVGDYVAIVLVFTNGAMSFQSWSFKPSQIITSPYDTPTRTPRPISIGHPFIF